MRILVFDNYDSFTYNLVHLVEKIVHRKVDVYRNDKIALEKIKEYDKIILSPGPGLPLQAGLLPAVIREFALTKSILGVCLGHQAIAESFGGSLRNLTKVYHGVATACRLNTTKSIFKNLPGNVQVGHYHSWIVDENDLPPSLEIIARDEDNNIMALQHSSYDVCGVQFHPESVLTPEGDIMLANWLRR